MDLKDILIAFPAEEINVELEKREFWIPEKRGTSAHFFSYLESTQEIEISSACYSINNPELISIMEEEFRKFEVHEEEHAVLANKFKELKNNQSIIHQIDFSKGQDLDSIQVQKYQNERNPDKLEHFTDWLIDYIAKTKIWQVRYPKRILKISLVEDVDVKDIEVSTGTFSKYAILEDVDASAEKYFVRVDFYYDLDVSKNIPNNPEFEFFETKAFFFKGNTWIDPSELEDFDFWYRVLILEEDSYEDDGDYYDEEVDM